MRVTPRRPYNVVVPKVDVDDRADGRGMANRCNAAGGFCNS